MKNTFDRLVSTPIEEVLTNIWETPPEYLIKTLQDEEKFSLKDAKAAVEEYRRYMALRLLYGPVSMISGPIDAVWHIHILHTREYAKFCDRIFGEFVHHSPEMTDAGISSTISGDGFVAIYHTEFKVVPSLIWLWSGWSDSNDSEIPRIPFWQAYCG